MLYSDKGSLRGKFWKLPNGRWRGINAKGQQCDFKLQTEAQRFAEKGKFERLNEAAIQEAQEIKVGQTVVHHSNPQYKAKVIDVQPPLANQGYGTGRWSFDKHTSRPSAFHPGASLLTLKLPNGKELDNEISSNWKPVNEALTEDKFSDDLSKMYAGMDRDTPAEPKQGPKPTITIRRKKGNTWELEARAPNGEISWQSGTRKQLEAKAEAEVGRGNYTVTEAARPPKPTDPGYNERMRPETIKSTCPKCGYGSAKRVHKDLNQCHKCSHLYRPVKAEANEPKKFVKRKAAGEMTWHGDNGFDKYGNSSSPCPACKGKEKQCRTCSGTGRVWTIRKEANDAHDQTGQFSSKGGSSVKPAEKKTPSKTKRAWDATKKSVNAASDILGQMGSDLFSSLY